MDTEWPKCCALWNVIANTNEKYGHGELWIQNVLSEVKTKDQFTYKPCSPEIRNDKMLANISRPVEWIEWEAKDVNT